MLIWVICCSLILIELTLRGLKAPKGDELQRMRAMYAKFFFFFNRRRLSMDISTGMLSTRYFLIFAKQSDLSMRLSNYTHNSTIIFIDQSCKTILLKSCL